MHNADNAERFIHHFHERFPGATSRSLADGVTHGGVSSYDLLASVIPDGDERLTILDLACGDGFLLERIISIRGDRHDFIGVDISSAELEAARRRLAAHDVRLLCERAQNLSVPNASVDYVLCHMALMLMNDVDTVVGEISRVLRPGGTLAAVVGGGDLQKGDAFELFIRILKELSSQERGARSSFGDLRARSAEGLTALFSPGAGFTEPITVEDFCLRINAQEDRIWEVLSETYDVALLSTTNRAILERKFREELKSTINRDGSFTCSIGLRFVSCMRKHL